MKQGGLQQEEDCLLGQPTQRIARVEQPLVGGGSANFVDFQASLASHLPIALAIIVVATLVILFLMTGSVILPIKSLIMNALNLSAVFGLLVLIFQDGRLEGLLSYSSPGALDQSIPIQIGRAHV